MKVLIVDDDRCTLEIVSALLEEHGIESELCNIPNDKLPEDTFDVVITDYNMPTTNGFEVSKKFSCPVVLMTGNINNIDKWRLEGFTDVVCKPFKRGALVKAVLGS